jgi:hypothetical protein
MQTRPADGEARRQDLQGVVRGRKCLSRIIRVVLSFCLLVPSAGMAQNVPPARAVTSQEAEELVRHALDPRSLTLPKFGLDNFKDTHHPDFYFFDATWDSPGGHLGGFAVDSKTGDVWAAAICRRYNSRRLRSFQKEIRKQIGLNEREYRKLKRPGPMC